MKDHHIDQIDGDAKNEEVEEYCIADQPNPSCFPTFFKHIGALFIKRFHISRRNWKGLLVEVFIPAILILVGFGFSKI